MDQRSIPGLMEYRLRLRYASEVQYTVEGHTCEDVAVDDYFHNISQGWLQPADMIHVCVRHEDKSWSKGVFEVIRMDAGHTVVEQIGKWRSGGRAKLKKVDMIDASKSAAA